MPGVHRARHPDGADWASVWLWLGLATVVLVLVSGGLSRSRRSPGMHAAGTFLVQVRGVGGSEYLAPSRALATVRWLIVLALFAIGSLVGSDGFWGVGLVLGAWLPSLFAGRRALYDWLTGTAVVSPALLDGDAGPHPGSVEVFDAFV